MAHPHVISKLMLVDSSGRIICRRPGVWSSVSDACLGCGRTDKPHEAKGRCQLCYSKWRRATNDEYRARVNAQQKARSLRSDYRERYDAARRTDPKRRQQRRAISNRWAEKHSKWPIGSTVEYVFVPGCPPIKGTILSKTNTRALVQFATFKESIPFARLSKVQTFQVAA